MLAFVQGREGKRKREGKSQVYLYPIIVLVNRAWTWYTPKVGGGQWMRVVSQSAPDRGVDNIPRWTLCSRTEET